jgi:UV DNA damage endonuclease
MMVWLARAGITMYRMSSELAPYATHPSLPEFHNQVEECRSELAAVGRLVIAAGLRVSIHVGQHVVLSAPEPQLVARSSDEVCSTAALLDAMGLGAEAVLVSHIGGLYGDRDGSRERFTAAWSDLPAAARCRHVLENDDVCFSVEDTLLIHREIGVRLVFDRLHHRLNNPAGLGERDALAACLATWPPDVRPKVHFSSPRTEFNVDQRPAGVRPRIRAPRWHNHADYVNPFEFIDFVRQAEGLRPFDVMLEAGARDLALLRLRRDLVRYAPDLARRLEPQPAALREEA